MASQKRWIDGWSFTQMGAWEMHDFHRDLLSAAWKLSSATFFPQYCQSQTHDLESRCTQSYLEIYQFTALIHA